MCSCSLLEDGLLSDMVSYSRFICFGPVLSTEPQIFAHEVAFIKQVIDIFIVKEVSLLFDALRRENQQIT